MGFLAQAMHAVGQRIDVFFANTGHVALSLCGLGLLLAGVLIVFGKRPTS